MMAVLVLAADVWIVGGTLPGGASPAAVHVQGGRVAGVGGQPPAGAAVLDATGLFLAPAVVDAHVHLVVAGPPAEVARAELRAGIAAVLDLGAPERTLGSLSALAPLRAVFAGPLLTAPKGYPTQSWGKDGYGLELRTAADAQAAVERLARSGAKAVKLAFDERYALIDPAVAKAACAAARARGLRTFAHALDVATVQRALEASVDVLAHTPVEPLPAALVAEVGRRKLRVLSTLQAFGATDAAVANLRALRAAGATVVYGTDLGNQGTAPGVDARELALLAKAGLAPAEVLHAATAEGAALLGLGDLGAIAVGKAASLLALPADPHRDPTALAHPSWTMIDGVKQ